ncbi:MAG: Na+/H+ antiporter NhaA [Candidatus Paracaedibacteraceae bacterium]|nr:Na+/H+ antiporter NhaA [Candidatus Paracaedibacteraceae bacterium]
MMQGKIKLVTLAKSEVASGLVIIFTFITALILANLHATSHFYQDIVFLPITMKFGDLIYETTVVQIVNDGLMTLFFLFIGMELKYQLVCGEYQDRKTLVMPAFAAIGGIVVPALVYWFFNRNQESIKGWAIPIATDTAFLLGVVSLFGEAISKKVRAFIVSFSLIDDALALLILAIFYTANINFIALSISVGLVCILLLLNARGVQQNSFYLLLGFFLWLSMVESGCHGTLSGAILALTLPVMVNGKISSSFHQLEKILRPLVCFVILPLFVFINSGIDLDSISVDILKAPISLGIIAGLFVGKPLGLFGFSWLSVRLKLARLPHQISWSLLYAVSVLGGIGFTLSLFIGDLTFEATEPNYTMRVGVIIGSVLSAIYGCICLFLIKKEYSHSA